MSTGWLDESPVADDRWADDALFSEPQMRYPAEAGGDGSGGGTSARVWRRWLLFALVAYVALWGLL